MVNSWMAFETPLRDLRALCVRQGLSSSGSKAKVLRRLKQHYEVLERQMAGQLAHKLLHGRGPQPRLTACSPAAKCSATGAPQRDAPTLCKLV